MKWLEKALGSEGLKNKHLLTYTLIINTNYFQTMDIVHWLTIFSCLCCVVSLFVVYYGCIKDNKSSNIQYQEGIYDIWKRTNALENKMASKLYSSAFPTTRGRIASITYEEETTKKTTGLKGSLESTSTSLESLEDSTIQETSTSQKSPPDIYILNEKGQPVRYFMYV